MAKLCRSRSQRRLRAPQSTCRHLISRSTKSYRQYTGSPRCSNDGYSVLTRARSAQSTSRRTWRLTFRFNRRTSHRPGLLFLRLLQGAVASGPLRYDQLAKIHRVKRPGHSPMPPTSPELVRHPLETTEPAVARCPLSYRNRLDMLFRQFNRLELNVTQPTLFSKKEQNIGH